jgi:beta-glucosidase
MTKAPSFPPGFLWGAASAAYQVEGASGPEERGRVGWDAYLAAGRGFRGDTGETAADHIARVEEDLDLLARLGVDSYRFSVAWARVMPDSRTAAPRGLDFYERLVDGLLERGITPLATLYHMDLPEARTEAGGWANRDTALAFADYAAHVVGRLGDRVELWATVNEPYFEAWLSHYDGSWPPGGRDLGEAVSALHHLLLGHGLAVGACRAASPRPIRIGLVNSCSPSVPGTGSEADVLAAARVDAHTTRFVLDPLFLGRYPQEVLDYHNERGSLGAIRDGDLETISTPADYLGVNYYQRRHVVALQRPEQAAHAVPDGYALRYLTDLGTSEVVPAGLERSAMGLPIEPSGLSEILGQITERYGTIPLYVTECGLALADYVNPEGRVNDEERVRFLDGHIAAAADAIEAGVDLRGFYVWSLLDNLEWNLGYAPRFGLVYVDFATQTRYPKRSFEWYREFLATHRDVQAASAWPTAEVESRS